MTHLAPKPTRTLALGLIVLIGAVLCGVMLRAETATGLSADVLGQTKKTPRPSCPTPQRPDNPTFSPPASRVCQAVGQVTGLQTRADGEFNPYKVPTDGRIVAFSIDLSEPSTDEQKFFAEAPASGPSVTDGVGWGKPSAKLSVLKKLKNQRYKLVKESRKVVLESELGRNPIFTLGKPLKVKAGLFVGISTGSWVSNLAHDDPAATTDGDQWLASRGSKHCGFVPGGASKEEAIAIQQDAIDHSKPARKIGKVRPFKCRYTAARLLYQAYYVPTGK